MPDPSQPEDAKTTGNPASLFDTDELRPIRVPEPPAPAETPASVSDGYELEGYSVPEVEETPRPIPILEPVVERPKKPRPKAPTPLSGDAPGLEEGGSTEFATELSDVDPIWTRMGEWGPDLYRVGACGFATLFLSWLFGFGTLGVLIFLAGAAATVLLSYPLLVTLERPVRTTPELAVNDFFAAASHHFPHYRRMWLLLSVVGRESGRFHSFEGFRDYWKKRIEDWRRDGGAGRIAPLKFEIDGFQSDKSTGKSTSRADYTVNVYLRDREDVGPIATFRMAHGLVRGDDRMWYLNRGKPESTSK